MALQSGIEAGRVSAFRLHNFVLPTLMAAGIAAVLTTGFVTSAPNRLLSGRPIGLFAAADLRLGAAIGAVAAFLLLSALVPPARALQRAAALLAGGLFLLVLAASGQAAASLAAGAHSLTRISLGAGFWILLGTAALALVDALQRAGAGVGERLAVIAVLAVATAAMAHAGLFDALSLAREYKTRHDLFGAALFRHIVLVAAAVGPAVLIGFPLGVAAVRRPRVQEPLFAVLNLLQNALEAMPQGGTVTLEGQGMATHVQLQVRDTGSGIPAADLAQIFEPLYTTKPEGTGLGLYIVQEIVTAHEGQITVESVEGQGTIFTLTLPRVEG